MKDKIRKFYSHPISWFLTIYIIGFIIASVVISPVALFHPLATLTILGTFFGVCYYNEINSKSKDIV